MYNSLKTKQTRKSFNKNRKNHDFRVENIRWKNFLSTGNQFIEVNFQTDSESRFAKNSTTLVVGTNGAGKSTLFNCISRVYPIDEGEIHLGNIRIDKMPAHKIATLGVGRSFQLTRVLDELSVTENLSSVSYTHLTLPTKA